MATSLSSSSSRQGQIQSSVGRAIILKGPNPNSRTYFTALPATLDSLILKARSLFPVPANHTPHITLGTDESAILLPDALPFLKERELLIFRWIPDTPTNQSRKGNANSNRVKWDSSILEAEKKQKEKEKEKLQQPSNSNPTPTPTSSPTSSPPKNDSHPPSIIQSNISPPQLERISSAGNGAAGTARGPAARAAHVQRVLKEQREKAAREAEEEKEKEKEKEEMEHKQRLEELKAIESQISEMGNQKQKQKEVPEKEREEAMDEQSPPRVENEEEDPSQSLKDSETSIEVEKEGNVEAETVSKDPEPQPSTPSVESSDPIPSITPSSASTSGIATATTDTHASPTISEDQDRLEEEERSSPPPYTSPEQSQPRPQTQSESEPIQEHNISNNKKLNEKKKAPSLVVVLPTPPSTAHRNSKTSKNQTITEDAQEREDQDVPSSPLSSPTTARVARSVISNAASLISREKQKAAPVEVEDIDQMQMDIIKGRLGSDSDDEEETVTDGAGAGAGVAAEESVESEIEMDVDEDEDEDEDHVMGLDSPNRTQEQRIDIEESLETSRSQDSNSIKGQDQDSEESLENSRGDSNSAALDEDDHSVEVVIGLTTSKSEDSEEVSSNDDGDAAEEFQQDSEMTKPSLDDDDDRDEKVAVEVDQQAYTIMSQVLNGMKEHPCNTFFREAMQEEEKVAVEARGLVPIDFFSIKESIESRFYSSLNYSSTISSATDEASRSSISNSEALARFSSDLSFMWNNTLQLYGERSSQYQCAMMLSKFGETVMKEMSRRNSNPNKGSSSSRERHNGVRGSLFKNGESSSSSKNQSGRTKAVRKAGLNPSATGEIMDIFNEQMNGRGNALLNGEFRLGRNGRTQGASANGNGSPHSRGEKRPITNPAFEIFLSQNKPLASRRSKNGGALPAQSAAFMAGAAAQRKLNGAPPLKRRATEGNRVVNGVTSNPNATFSSTSSPPLSSSTSLDQVSQTGTSFGEKQVSEERSVDNELEEMEQDDDDDVLTPPPPSKKEKAINLYKCNVLEKANQAAAAVLGVRR